MSGAARAVAPQRESGIAVVTAATPDVGAIVSQVEALTPHRRVPAAQLIATAARCWSLNTVCAFLSDLGIWEQLAAKSGASARLPRRFQGS